MVDFKKHRRRFLPEDGCNSAVPTYLPPYAVAPGHPMKKEDSSWWSRLNGRMNETADNFFYRLGYWVARHSKLTLLICFILVAACCSGFVNFEFVTDCKWQLIIMSGLNIFFFVFYLLFQSFQWSFMRFQCTHYGKIAVKLTPLHPSLGL